MNSTDERSAWRSRGAAAALVVGGLIAGGVLASTLSANAAGTTPTPSASTPSGSQAAPQAPRDETKSQRSDEHLLTGTTAAKVRALTLAKYPGATIQRVETDSDGVYEAHIVTTAGARLIVQVGADFTVTGVQTHGPGGGRGPDNDGTAGAATGTGA
ncbi:MAG: hypothetical protein QOH80_743 [Actinomycetota bacterium]|nr:hypothetical protein [Actinomycetota bacterium]